MKCNNCGSEWKVSTKISFSETKCPFCGSPLASEKKTFETLEDVLVEIRDKYGLEILGDGGKLLAYFGDLAPQLRKQKIWIKNFVEIGGPARIMEIQNDSFDEQCRCIKWLVREMNEELSIDEKACRTICGVYYFVVTGRHFSEEEAVQEETGQGQLIRNTEEQNTEQKMMPEEQYRQGNGFLQKSDYLHAAEWYKKAAEQGCAPAQISLGHCYEKGTGVTRNYEEAFFWYKKGAEQGYDRAEYNVGYCYENGIGTNQDYEEAVFWYKRAAEKGNVRAQANLGYCYTKGNGISQNHEKAVLWYRKAAEQGYAYAQTNLGYCYEKGLGIKRNIEEAIQWYGKAAEQGNINAQKSLERCLNNSETVQKLMEEAQKADENGDATKAFVLYKKVAESGNAEACFEVGYMYEYGSGTEENLAEAVKYYSLAAKTGHRGALHNLGIFYYTGKGVKVDYKKAFELLHAAADKGKAESMHDIGVMYENGDYVKQDYKEAMTWYEKAEQNGYSDAKEDIRRVQNKLQNKYHIYVDTR